jgi:hypothetical protein
VGGIADRGAEHELTDGKDLAVGAPLLGARRWRIQISLTVSDPGHLCNRHRPESPADLAGARSALLVPVSVPYAGAVPDGGLIR